MAARKLTVYKEATAQLVAFEKQYNSILPDCTTPKGMQAAKDCRKEIRDARSNLEDLRKETKAPVLAKGTQIDTEAKAIKERLDVLFTKFDSHIKEIENAKEIAAKKELDDVARMVGNMMSSIVKLNIPLVVNLKVGANWLEMDDFGTYGM